MKATLKHINNQYILIVDERPSINEWYLDDVDNVRLSYVSDTTFWESRGNYCKILAHENLDGVKGIGMVIDDKIQEATQYIGSRYTISQWFEDNIDTEVEVTEHEDYYLIKL